MTQPQLYRNIKSILDEFFPDGQYILMVIPAEEAETDDENREPNTVISNMAVQDIVTQLLGLITELHDGEVKTRHRRGEEPIFLGDCME